MGVGTGGVGVFAADIVSVGVTVQIKVIVGTGDLVVVAVELGTVAGAIVTV